MKCLKCGTEIQENEKFCSNCGNEIIPQNNINNNQMNDMNKEEKPNKPKNNKILIGLVIAIMVIIGLICFLNFNKTNEEVNENNETKENIDENKDKDDITGDITNNEENNNEIDNELQEEKSDETIEEEISETKKFKNPNYKYEYLIDRLYNECYNIDVFTDAFNINKLNNTYVLQAALYELSNSKDIDMKQIKISKENEFYEELSQLGKLNKNNTVDGYTSEQVLSIVKKIFGKNVNAKQESVINYWYIKESDAFIDNPNFGCSKTDGKIQEIISVNNKDNKIDITVAVASFDKINNKLYDLNKKFITLYEIDDNYEKVINGITIEEYVYNNSNKFTQYKYIFTLEDGNYIFTGLEKIK